MTVSETAKGNERESRSKCMRNGSLTRDMVKPALPDTERLPVTCSHLYIHALVAPVAKQPSRSWLSVPFYPGARPQDGLREPDLEIRYGVPLSNTSGAISVPQTSVPHIRTRLLAINASDVGQCDLTLLADHVGRLHKSEWGCSTPRVEVSLRIFHSCHLRMPSR